MRLQAILVFDGQNPEFSQRLADLTEACEEAEISLVEALSASREHLGRRHELIATLIANNDIGVPVGQTTLVCGRPCRML